MSFESAILIKKYKIGDRVIVINAANQFYKWPGQIVDIEQVHDENIYGIVCYGKDPETQDLVPVLKLPIWIRELELRLLEKSPLNPVENGGH